MGKKINYNIGVDVGGSHITAAIVNLDLNIILKESIKTIVVDASASINDVLGSLIALISHVKFDFNNDILKGIGIAMPGPFEYQRGISAISGLNKYDRLFGFNLKQALASEFKLKANNVLFENDAACFGLGEYWSYSIKPERLICITLGTGFGATFIDSGHVIKNRADTSKNGELWNMPFKGDIAENIFSGRALLATYESLSGVKLDNVKELADAAVREFKAREVFGQFAENLAEFMSPWLKKFKADKFVIGGNISKAHAMFLPLLIKIIKDKGINTEISISTLLDKAAILGSALLSKSQHVENNILRKSSQDIAPLNHNATNDGAYDIYPSHKTNKSISMGFSELALEIINHKNIAIDGYIGVFYDDFKEKLDIEFNKLGKKAYWWDVYSAMKAPEAIDEMLKPYLGGDDPLFGTRCPLDLIDFFDKEKIKLYDFNDSDRINIVIGCGASLIMPNSYLVYVDLPKNELQFRMRAGSITNLGADKLYNNKAMYKRSYFVDWNVLNKHKQQLLSKLNLIVDAQRPDEIVWMNGNDFRDCLEEMSRNSFRVRPWFEPGSWGGQWMKNNIKGLPQDVPNYAWSFELIVPENGLMISDANNLMFECSFDYLMYHNNKAVIGDCADRFGYEFPIRFDYLDTFDGGNLSVQCHPREAFIKKNFGETFTQDETYYILETQNNAEVYLGFQDDINPDEFKKALEESAENATPVDIKKYVQTHPANKHDLFLIPNGTVHGSGKDNLVLEISSTPYIFTFKMYDWLRLDLDGKPRVLNIDRAFENLYFDRKGERVKKEFISHPITIETGNDWQLIHLPTHPEHFYDVHRFEFTTDVNVNTDNHFHILMLVEGSSIMLETNDGLIQRMNYAETFVVSAATGSYKLINESGGVVKVVKAFMK